MTDQKESMNKELLEWIKESKAHQKLAEKKQEKPPTKPTGYCSICGDKKAEAICIKCNRNVCSTCYFQIISVCKECVPKEISEKWEGKRPDWEKELGVEWVY